MSGTVTGATSASSETTTGLFNARVLKNSLDARHAFPTTARQCRPSPLDNGCDALCGRGLTERGDDAVDHFLDQDAVVALAHHADHRLGAGGADQQAAMTVEPFFTGIDGRFDL